ncbi:MAG: hypothetical protein F9K23_16100 [Bacteroidetes bacterium]|nr:MAG: hypothetical protein F9K23_16100 [Bacteroidota bacterium]
MKRLIPLTIILLGANTLFSQVPSKQTLDSVQYQIIRATVDFLATDTKTFGKVKGTCINCNVNDYAALKKYADDNKLAKVPDLINEWKKISLDTSEAGWMASVESFRKKIHYKIADGEKKERQKLIGYEPYNIKLDSIINRLNTLTKSKQPLEQESAIRDGDTDEISKAESDNEEDGILSSLSAWQNISLAACIVISLLVLMVSFLTNKKKAAAHNRNVEKLTKKHKDAIAELQRENKLLEAEKKKMDATITHLESELKNEREKNYISKQPQIVDEQKSVSTQKPESRVKYASYADQGDGFSVGSLLNQSNSEAIFEISLTSSNTASYKVSSDNAIQRYALSNAAFFLGTTCKYDTEPNSQQGIVTEKPGELKLQGNKWIITVPAVISFR